MYTYFVCIFRCWYTLKPRSIYTNASRLSSLIEFKIDTKSSQDIEYTKNSSTQSINNFKIFPCFPSHEILFSSRNTVIWIIVFGIMSYLFHILEVWVQANIWLWTKIVMFREQGIISFHSCTWRMLEIGWHNFKS